MAEELKALIEKIQEEGVKAAEAKAASIEDQAMRRADEMVRQAEKDARRAIDEAQSSIAKMEEGAKESIRQAGRDTVLALKKEISEILGRIVETHVHKALSPEELARILVTVIKGCGGENKDKVIVSIRKEDLERVEKAVFAELGQEAKKGIILKAAADIKGGFHISYDSGKSFFDFSDRSLAEYLAQHLKGRLAELLKESVQ